MGMKFLSHAIFPEILCIEIIPSMSGIQTGATISNHNRIQLLGVSFSFAHHLTLPDGVNAWTICKDVH